MALNAIKCNISFHNTQANIYIFCVEICPKYEDKILSKNFSAEMEIHKIDPR
jgi:hypothetical protein